MKWRACFALIGALSIIIILATNVLIHVFGLPMSVDQHTIQVEEKPHFTLQERLSGQLRNLKLSNKGCRLSTLKTLEFLKTKTKYMPNITFSLSSWKKIQKWVTTQKIHENHADLSGVLSALKNNKITHADVERKGTQLKLSLTLFGNQKVIFKPQWYARNLSITGKVYDGKDRHNAEIAAFHLSRLLKLNRAPIACGRKLDLINEILPVATDRLLNTFIKKDNDTCFYGECYYCSSKDPVCGNGTVLEGVMILWLPFKYKLLKQRNPWQRTYKEDLVAKWEQDDSYCFNIENLSRYYRNNYERLLDLIETSIFDFLISNGDRHHYEIFASSDDSSILLLDNGKSFGNANIDYLDILAPLYQCCKVRKTFFHTLKEFEGVCLGESLDKLLISDAIYPILHEDHLKAIDRRLAEVIFIIDDCISRFQASNVLY